MKIHFLGIAGSGTSAVAAIAKAQGFEVDGCDIEPINEFTKSFGSRELLKGHSKDHLYSHPQRSVDLLVITPAILSLDPNNEELLEAKKQNIPVLTWQQFMGDYLMKDKYVIAVCGTHGKSTTTAMIAQMLEDAGLDPTVELGAIIPRWDTNLQQSSQFSQGSNCRVGKSKYFVTEADEFNDNYLHTKPDITVVTNIDFDHPEYFKNFENYKTSFRKFLSQTKQKIIANLSDPIVKEVLASHLEGVDVIIDYSDHPIDFPLKVIGDFNRLNASAAFQVGLTLGLDSTTIRNSLMQFSGIGRRMEYLGEFKGAKVYSDFAHHPTEIKKTLEAVREKYPEKRIVVVYQPHMFSRTKVLFNDFVKVFQELTVNQTFILDIYPSREIDTGIVSSKQLVEAVGKNNVSFLGSTIQAQAFLKIAIRKDDLLIFMGAGDIDKLARLISI